MATTRTFFSGVPRRATRTVTVVARPAVRRVADGLTWQARAGAPGVEVVAVPDFATAGAGSVVPGATGSSAERVPGALGSLSDWVAEGTTGDGPAPGAAFGLSAVSDSEAEVVGGQRPAPHADEVDVAGQRKRAGALVGPDEVVLGAQGVGDGLGRRERGADRVPVEVQAQRGTVVHARDVMPGAVPDVGRRGPRRSGNRPCRRRRRTRCRRPWRCTARTRRRRSPAHRARRRSGRRRGCGPRGRPPRA